MATVTEQAVPPLSAGDTLTREEFFRRWEAHPEIKNAELIRGIVYMPSPVSMDHGEFDRKISWWMEHYAIHTPGVGGGSNATWCVEEDAPQPDGLLLIDPELGGSSRVEASYLHGIPEMVAEVSRSSVSYDLHAKLELYEEARVPEYLAILLYEQEIRWHILVDGKYQPLNAGPDGIWRSRVFPGLWLDGKALLAGNMVQVLAKLQEGLASREHADFVNTLSLRRKS